MARWEPNARERLERAALALFMEHGFDATTVTEITARAGLTKSTFFRHFADKREVLFGGQDLLTGLFTDAIQAAPSSATILDCLGAALSAAAVALSDALRARGTDDTTARLAAELGMLAFSAAYARWADPRCGQAFTEIAH